MTLFLYKGAHATKDFTGNAGLWFDKFCDTRNRDEKESSKGDAKSKWLMDATNRRFSKELLDEHLMRRAKLLRALEGHPLTLRTTWAFATGLGRPHPIENGFAFQHALGVPYLPGSGVKGILRSYARETLGEQNGLLSRKDIDSLFGPLRDGSEDYQAGTLICFDALPTTPPTLCKETMTVHYGAWYGTSGDNRDWPADWNAPVPVPFLAVKRGAIFHFGLALRPGGDRRLLEWAVEALPRALEELGAGAKTAVGYGRFERVNGPPLVPEVGLNREQALVEKLRKDELAAFEQADEFLRRAEEGEAVDISNLSDLPWIEEWAKGQSKNQLVRSKGEKKLKKAARLLREGPAFLAPQQIPGFSEARPVLPEDSPNKGRLEKLGNKPPLEELLKCCELARQKAWRAEDRAYLSKLLEDYRSGPNQKRVEKMIKNLKA